MKNTNILINYKINALEKYILALMKKKNHEKEKQKKKFPWTYFFREIEHLVKHYFHSLDKHRKKYISELLRTKCVTYRDHFSKDFLINEKKMFNNIIFI